MSASVTDTQLASPNNGAYRPIASGGQQIIGAEKEGTRYFMGRSGTGEMEGSTSGNSLLLFYFAKADYEVIGKTQKLRMRAQVVTTVAPAVTLTFGLYPVTATSSGQFTIGTVTSGSTIAFATPSANTLNQGNSGDFTIPSDGYYVIGVANSGKTAGAGVTACAFQLQTHSV